MGCVSHARPVVYIYSNIITIMLKEWFCEGTCRRKLFAWLGLFVFLGHAVFKAWLKMRLNGWYERCARQHSQLRLLPVL